MNDLRRISGVLLAAALAWTVQCGPGDDIAGAGGGGASSSPNAFIQGQVLDATGTPVAGATVSIIATGHTPSLTGGDAGIVETVTDADGIYGADSLDAGLYNVMARTGTAGGFVDSVPAYDTSNTVPDLYLRDLGSVTGILHMAGLDDTSQIRAVLYLPGTDLITKPDIGGAFVFGAVPAGQYRLIIDPTLGDYDPAVVDIDLAAGQALDLDTLRLDVRVPDTLDISQATAWGTWHAGQVVRVFTHIEVPAARTLMIEPGVEVRVMGNYEITVTGTITAVGTADSLILFTHGTGTGGTTVEWQGISMQKGSSAVLEYCIVEHHQSVEIGHPAPGLEQSVSNCVFRYGDSGLYLSVSDTSVNLTGIRNNVFHDLVTGISCNGTLAHMTYGVEASNCIFSGISGEVFRFGPFIDPRVTASHCCFYDYSGLTNESVTVTAGVYADPLFNSTAIGVEDYTLQSGSPCEGTGVDGTDMGCYSVYRP